MHQRILIYVPGFPGEAIPSIPGEKRVVDVVSEIAAGKKLNLEVVSYPGIKTDEPFTFKKTQSHTFKIIKEKIEKGYSVTLIGQSWGGLISLLALNQFVIDRLVLITPFVLPLSEVEITSILKMYSDELPILLPKDSITSNVKDVITIFDSLKKITENKKLIPDVRVLAATDDEIIPINGLKDFFSSSDPIAPLATITEIKNDHDFSHGKNDLAVWLEQNV